MQPSVAAASSLQSTGSIVVAHKPGCSMTRGIFLEQGSNLCLLHWEAGSLPLSHQWSPVKPIQFLLLYNFYSIFVNHHCNREEQNLAPCWICFLQPLLSAAFVTITTKRMLPAALSMHNGLCGEPCPSAWTFNQSAFKVQFTGRPSDPAHLWMAAGRKKWTHPHILSPRLTKPGDILQDLWPFNFTSSPPSFPLFSVP